MLALACGAVYIGLVCSSSFWLLNEQFTPEVRFSGVGISYNIGLSLGGGIAPFLGTWLINYYQENIAAGMVLVFAGLCGFAAFLIHCWKKNNEIFSCSPESS